MNSIDDLRDALRSLERLAPEQLPAVADRAELLPPGAEIHRRPHAWVFAAAASLAVALAATLIVLVPHGRSTVSAPRPTPLPPPVPHPTSLSALGCPSSLGSPARTWVPAAPHGFDGTTRLAPADVPRQLTICAYPGKDSPTRGPGAIRLNANVSIAGELFSQLPDNAPGGCDLMLEPTDRDQYLVRMTYQHASVWIAVSGDHCGGVSNGRFTSATFLGSLISSWYLDGAISPPGAITCGGTRQGLVTGRLDQASAMVPDRPTSVQVCGENGGSTSRTIVGPVLTQLVRDLNAPQTSRMTQGYGCRPTGSTSTVRNYVLLFHYSSGPVVLVYAFANCVPEIQNGTLAIDTAPSLVAEIQRLETR